MLIFGRGLKIAFWNVGKTAIIEGKIRYKMPTQVAENAYVVKTAFESDDCIVPYDRITQVLLKDFDDHDVWVTIDELYKSFLNGSVICPDTKYDDTSLKVRLSQISTDSLKYATPCPTVNIEPIKDLSELANQYISMDIKACDEFYKKGIEDNMNKPIVRNSGRYPWVNASGIKFQGKYYKTNGLPVPKKVIFNGPATVVLWTDNTKTVVKKSKDEPDDREKALMYCIFKKFLDDKKRDMDRYLKLFYKVLEEDKKDEEKKEEAGSSKLHWKKQRAGSDSSESTV